MTSHGYETGRLDLLELRGRRKYVVSQACGLCHAVRCEQAQLDLAGVLAENSEIDAIASRMRAQLVRRAFDHAKIAHAAEPTVS